MVQVLSGLPPRPRGADRHPAAPARGRRQLSPLHARRADGGGGRLPRGAPGGRGAAPGAGGRRPSQRGALVHPDGRVPRLGRDDRAQPADGARSRGRLRWRDGAGLPARHVRPHCADAPDPAAGRFPRRRGLAGRALAGDQERLHLGVPRRLLGPRRIPAGRVRQRGGAARRRQGAHPPHARQRGRGGRIPHGRPALHERVGPPHAPTLARAGGGRGQRPAGRVRLRGDLVPPLPGRRSRARD